VLRPFDLDGLVRLGVGQVRGHVGADVTFALRLLALLGRLGGREADRQARLLAEAFETTGAPEEDRARVRAAAPGSG